MLLHSYNNSCPIDLQTNMDFPHYDWDNQWHINPCTHQLTRELANSCTLTTLSASRYCWSGNPWEVVNLRSWKHAQCSPKSETENGTPSIPVSSFCRQNVPKEPEEAQQDILSKRIKNVWKVKEPLNLQSSFTVYSFKFW